MFIGGDFNGRLGRLSDEERTLNITNHVGRHGMGDRNFNGEHLLNFCVLNDLFACNTSFQHKSRHITTRTGWIKDTSGKQKSRPVYSQIDYVLCRTRSKCILQDARSFGGSTVSSDHRIVRVTADIGKPYLVHKQGVKQKRYCVSHLTANTDIQNLYRDTLTNEIDCLEYSAGDDPQSKLQSILKIIKSTATDVVGIEKTLRKANHSNDQLVVDLVEN